MEKIFKLELGEEKSYTKYGITYTLSRESEDNYGLMGIMGPMETPCVFGFTKTQVEDLYENYNLDVLLMLEFNIKREIEKELNNE